MNFHWINLMLEMQARYASVALVGGKCDRGIDYCQGLWQWAGALVCY